MFSPATGVNEFSIEDLDQLDGLLDAFLGGAPGVSLPQAQQQQPHAGLPQQQLPGQMPGAQMQPGAMGAAPQLGQQQLGTGALSGGLQGGGMLGGMLGSGLPGMQSSMNFGGGLGGGMGGQLGGMGMPNLGLGGLGQGVGGLGGMGSGMGGMSDGGMGGMGMGGMGMGGMGRGMPGMPGGLGGVTGMEALMGLQSAAGLQGGLMAGPAGVNRGSITTAAGLGMSMGMQPPPAFDVTRGRAPAATGSGDAGGGGAGGKKNTRGRSAGGGRQARKSEPEPAASSEDLDSNSDSASSDDEQAHKSSRKKRDTGNMDEAERRHAALQEKNRKAQRRFRERQKTKLQELHKQIEELTGKVSNLQTENAALHSRTSILEKVLDMRNEQIQVMQENKEVAEAELSSMAAPGQALVALTPDMLKELTSEEIYKIYQTYVKELSVRLVDNAGGGQLAAVKAASGEGGEGSRGGTDTDGGSSAAGTPAGGEGGEGGEGGQVQSVAALELERLVRELSVMLMRLGVAKPLETRKFIVFSRQYLGNTEKEVIELWKTVMKHIELNPEQVREIVDLKRMFLTKIEPIMDERKHLNVSIQTNLPHDTYHTKNSISYIKAHEAVSKLRDNLRSEQHVVLEFAVAVFRGVFKPRQMATLLVKCFPAVPDALGIASALASELGEPDSPATQQLAMQLGGYAVPTAQGGGGGASNLLSIHPSLLPMGANMGVQQQQMGGAGQGQGQQPGQGQGNGAMQGQAAGGGVAGMGGGAGGGGELGGMAAQLAQMQRLHQLQMAQMQQAGMALGGMALGGQQGQGGPQGQMPGFAGMGGQQPDMMMMQQQLQQLQQQQQQMGGGAGGQAAQFGVQGL